VAIASTLEYKYFPQIALVDHARPSFWKVVDGFTANENAGTGSREYRAEAENQFENFEDAGTLARPFFFQVWKARK
jgi:hypothetical protein